MVDTVLDRIRQLLRLREVDFREVHHAPTYTSEESARVRGESIGTGGKAIVMKMENEFKLFVLSASKRVDSQRIKEHVGIKKIRFATKEELYVLTDLVPGSIPPFGRPILPFDLCVDNSVTANEKIAFNAGSLTDSIIMNSRDYLKVTAPCVFEFSI